MRSILNPFERDAVSFSFPDALLKIALSMIEMKGEVQAADATAANTSILIVSSKGLFAFKSIGCLYSIPVGIIFFLGKSRKSSWKVAYRPGPIQLISSNPDYQIHSQMVAV